jgi:hypothetical protein
MSEVDDRIMWLASVICTPTRRDAARAAFDQIRKIDGFSAAGMPKRGTNDIFRATAERVRPTDPVLALAFELLALSTDDVAAVTHIVAGAHGLLCSAAGDTSEARARLRIWDDVARGKYDPVAYGGGFFEIADKYWRGEKQYIVAASPRGALMRDRYSHPALQLLMFSRWDAALGWLHGASVDVAQRFRLDDVMSCSADRVAVAAVISDIVEDLYAVRTPKAGALALAWQMLTADPRKPESFRFLPQLQFQIDHADVEAEDDADVRERIRIWWRGAEGEWTDREVSIFRIAAGETTPEESDEPEGDPPIQPHGMRTSTAATLFADLGLPTLVVMPKDKSTKLNNFNASFKDIVDAALPLVVVRDLVRMRGGAAR